MPAFLWIPIGQDIKNFQMRDRKAKKSSLAVEKVGRQELLSGNTGISMNFRLQQQTGI
jgi:hypothetical protein